MRRLMKPAQDVDDFRRGPVEEMHRILVAAGFDATPSAIQWAWQEYSDSMCAGWMIMPSHEDVVSILQQYLVEVE